MRKAFFGNVFLGVVFSFNLFLRDANCLTLREEDTQACEKKKYATFLSFVNTKVFLY